MTATRGCTQQESTADWGQQRKIWKEKEGGRYGKGGLEPQKQRFGSTKVKVWGAESKGLTLRNINKNHPRRSSRASASVDTSIRVDRYVHPRRSIRASASVDADDKSREYEEEKRWGERGKRRAWSGRKRGASVEKEGGVGMAGMPYPPNTTLLILCINNWTFASSINNKVERYIFR